MCVSVAASCWQQEDNDGIDAAAVYNVIFVSLAFAFLLHYFPFFHEFLVAC